MSSKRKAETQKVSIKKKRKVIKTPKTKFYILSFLWNCVEKYGTPLRETSKHPQGLVTEYLKFMMLKAREKDLNATLLSPSGSIDQVWHEHILNTRDYAVFCAALAKEAKIKHSSRVLFHHDPQGAEKKNEEARLVRQRNTLDKYLAFFGHPPPHHYWHMETWPFVEPVEAVVEPVEEKVKKPTHFEIRVCSLTGKTTILEVTSQTTMFEVARKIQDKDGIPPEIQSLIFAGDERFRINPTYEMSDVEAKAQVEKDNTRNSRTLAENNIGEDNVLHIRLRQRGC